MMVNLGCIYVLPRSRQLGAGRYLPGTDQVAGGSVGTGCH